jgi:hypothetical protein
MINHIASRHKLMLKTNAALERLVYPDKLPGLTSKINAVRRDHMALQIESGFKYMRMCPISIRFGQSRWTRHGRIFFSTVVLGKKE